MRTIRCSLVIGLLVSVWVSSCAVKEPKDFTDDQALYTYAEQLYQDGEYTEAIRFFESLRNRFPQSPYVTSSELKVADAYFEQGNYAEAEVAYQTFQSLHPTNQKIPYVLFRIGMTHYERIPGGIDRDQSHTEKAIAIFRELLARWPNAEVSSKAPKLISECEKMLAEKELYVADFYLRNEEFKAAQLRLKIVGSNAEFKDLQAEALYKLALTHFELKEKKEAEKVLAAVISNPDAGKYKRRAKQLLRKLSSL